MGENAHIPIRIDSIDRIIIWDFLGHELQHRLKLNIKKRYCYILKNIQVHI